MNKLIINENSGREKMYKLIFIIFFSTFSIIGMGEKVKKMNDLNKREDYILKKSSEVPFTGEVEGRYQGKFIEGKKDGLWLI